MKPTIGPRVLGTFTLQYIETMLWSSYDNADDQGGQPLDRAYSIDDLAPETLERIRADCNLFPIQSEWVD